MTIDDALATLLRDGDKLLQLVRVGEQVVRAWGDSTAEQRAELRRVLGGETEMHIALLAAREKARRTLGEP